MCNRTVAGGAGGRFVFSPQSCAGSWPRPARWPLCLAPLGGARSWSSSSAASVDQPVLIQTTSHLFYQQLFEPKDDAKEAFRFYKILQSLTSNSLFATELAHKDGGQAVERLFGLLGETTIHYSQEKLLSVLVNLAREEGNREIIIEKGAEELRRLLESKSTLRNVLTQALNLLEKILESKSQLSSSHFNGFIPAVMDLMIDFSDKPDLQIQLIRLLGTLSTDCSFEDYRKVCPLAAAMLIRHMQAYIFESLDSPFVTKQLTCTLQAIHHILSRPLDPHQREEEYLSRAFQDTFLQHDSKARYAVLNGLNCVVLLANSKNPVLSQHANEVADLLCHRNPTVAAELANIRSRDAAPH